MFSPAKSVLIALFCLRCLIEHTCDAKPLTSKTTPSPASVVTKVTPSTKVEMSQHSEDLKDLMLALYQTHPEELSKSTPVSAREMTDWVFENKSNWHFDHLRGLQGTQALALLFDPLFDGDHVLALIVGLETTLFTGYGAVNEFDIPHLLSPESRSLLACQIATLYQRLQNIEKDKTIYIKQAIKSNMRIQTTLKTIYARVLQTRKTNEIYAVCTDK